MYIYPLICPFILLFASGDSVVEPLAADNGRPCGVPRADCLPAIGQCRDAGGCGARRPTCPEYLHRRDGTQVESPSGASRGDDCAETQAGQPCVGDDDPGKGPEPQRHGGPGTTATLLYSDPCECHLSRTQEGKAIVLDSKMFFEGEVSTFIVHGHTVYAGLVNGGVEARPMQF